ncbi:hypothetical protein AaE_003610, partial [Aphanomyces astaci]
MAASECWLHRQNVGSFESYTHLVAQNPTLLPALTRTSFLDIMLAVQLKQTSSIDVIKPMRAYLSNEYSEDEAKKFDPALESFAQMRKDVELVRTPSSISRQVLL